MQLLLSVLRCLHVCECPVCIFFLSRDALKHRGNVNKNVFCWYSPKLQLFVPKIVEHLRMGYINKNMSLAWGVVCIRRPQNTFLFVRWQNPYVISPYKKTLQFFFVIQSPKSMSVFLLASLIQCTILFCAGLNRSLQFRGTTFLILADLTTYRPYTSTPKR